jgi:hypothetical protein
MNTCLLSPGGKYSPARKRLLYLILIGIGFIVFLPTFWVHQGLKSGVGLHLAQISMSFAMVILLGLVLAGMGLGYLIDITIRRQGFFNQSLSRASWVSVLIKAWGFDLIDKESEFPSIPILVHSLEVDDTLAILSKPRKRGRRPSYPIDRWKRVVLKWENRDTHRSMMTLTELLAEEFGTNADGSPKISEQTYYSWRNKVFAEMKKEAEANTLSPGKLREKSKS